MLKSEIVSIKPGYENGHDVVDFCIDKQGNSEYLRDEWLGEEMTISPEETWIDYYEDEYTINSINNHLKEWVQENKDKRFHYKYWRNNDIEKVEHGIRRSAGVNVVVSDEVGERLNLEGNSYQIDAGGNISWKDRNLGDQVLVNKCDHVYFDDIKIKRLEAPIIGLNLIESYIDNDWEEYEYYKVVVENEDVIEDHIGNIAPEFPVKYDIDIKHPVSLQLVTDSDDDHWVASWKTVSGRYCNTKSSDPKTLGTLCVDPTFIMAFLRDAINNGDFIVEYDDEPAAPAPAA